MISIVAFVINIGLFVKAKINLQNATDAAAYAGAAVQARQLSKIAYLNWEMRNIYKEWLYKYYVIGNLNIDDVENPKANGVMSFRLQKDVNVLTSKQTDDKFNIPAVCIHLSGSLTNICKRYSVPGLPEFGSTDLVGAEQASRAFMNTLISTKVNDCIDRTRLNMAVAMTWAYNVLGNSENTFAGQGPAIMADRQGAWPQAVELAIRIRNLEHVFNRPAEKDGVCISGSTNGVVNCGKPISAITAENKLGNERLVKAFYSAYRNLGNDQDNEMKNSFTLREISPRPVKIPSANNASNLLIPQNKFYEKAYLDLKLMMVNYAIFYAAMIPRADDKTSGACDISKVAIPVPGYPLGFYKNPDILTYYAVKGEAEFVGMFNPFFGSGNIVKLTAYSAAKPFGGRIGPMLFTQRENEDFIRQREDNQKRRSVPYITSYDFMGVTIREDTYTGDNYIPGLPLPTNTTKAAGSFWMKEGSPIGGLVADAAGVSFGVPNLVYDYETDYQMDGYSDPTKKINLITASTADTAQEKGVGLYSRYQFNRFRGNALTAAISPQTLDHEVARVRAPTKYEAANYLIPTPFEFNKAHDLDSFGFISGQKEELNGEYDRYHALVYAPLYRSKDQQDLLYDNGSEVTSSITSFMKAQKSGMRKYRMSLNQAAIQIFNEKENANKSAQVEGYERAASGVSDINFADKNNFDQVPKTCKSIAGEFLYFYWAEVEKNEAPDDDIAGCPEPLGKLFEKYFASKGTDTNFDPDYYSFKLTWNKKMSKEQGLQFLSAYTPGPFTGVQYDSNFVNPFPGSSITNTMRRNTYSTRFISLDSLQMGGGARWSNEFPMHSEGSVQASGGDTAHNFRNPLEAADVGLDLSSIKY